MKKFLKHTLLFILPVLIGWIILFIIPTDHKRAYHYLTDDCDGRAAWMYQRIYESKLPIDIAFLGSSHTINGVNDTLINNELANYSASKKKTCNLGYCRLGRDLTYVFMKALIRQKGTKTFIIEVYTDENGISHPVFSFLADSREIIDPRVLLNKNYFPNLYKSSVSKLMYIRQNIFEEPYVNKYKSPEQMGFNSNNFEADTNELRIKKERRYKKKFKQSNLLRDIDLQFPHAWLKAMSELAKSNDAEIVFLYIPSYGSPEKQPIEMETYTQYGQVWIAPDSIFTNKKNWYDHEHLNINGANSFSTWIAKKLMNEKLN